MPLLLCLFCACKQAATRPAGTNAGHKEVLAVINLLAKNSDYYYNQKDSLPGKAKWLRKMGRRYKNDTLTFYGDLFLLNYLYESGDYEAGMNLSLKVLDEAERLRMNKKVPEIYGLIGNLDKENLNYPMALQAAQKGYEVAVANKDTVKIIELKGLQAMFANGFSYRRHDSVMRHNAFRMQLEALKIAESSPRYENLRIRFYDNISKYYLDSNKFYQSIAYGNKGVQLSLKYNSQKSLSYSYCWIGLSYYDLGQKQLGFDYLNKALLITRQLKEPFRRMEIYEAIYESYERSSDFKNAFKYYKLHNRLSDSLKLANNNHQLNELQVKYDAVKKDNKINQLTTTGEAKTRKIAYIAIILCLVIVLSALIFKQYLTISQKNKQMVTTNKTIQEQSEKLQVLMKELHHRVKNNLQIVSSLLTLQLNRLNDEESRNAIKLGQQRIEAMSLIHRSLYQQENPTMVNMKEYITDLTESIMMSFGVDKNAFELHLDIAVTDLDVDVAMPLGLIINEWVTNAFKHAYKMSTLQPALWIKLNLENNLELEIRDNGTGMPSEMWERPQRSFGIKLVKVLAKQLRGTCTVDNTEGTVLNLQIPRTEIKHLLSA